jgi:phosphate transport system substrate-binding protein
MLGGFLVCLAVQGLAGGTALGQMPPSGKPSVDPAIGSYAASTGVAGAIVISGSDTMQPIIVKIASAFRQYQPGIKIAVQGGGTDASVLLFLQDQAYLRRGDADVSPKSHSVSGSIALLAASRPLTEQERKGFRLRYGYDVAEIPIAQDAIAIYVNRQNPVEGLSMEQLDAIFGRDRKRGLPEEVTTWGQVGLKEEWAQRPIHPYGQDKNSGTQALFAQEALLGGEFRATIQQERGPASEILALSRDILGIGYAGIGFQVAKVRIIPLAARDGGAFVAPSPESVANKTYPLGRQLLLYARNDPKAGLEPAVLEFLKFVNSREGQAMVVKAGAYPLSAHQVATNLRALGGTTVSAGALQAPLLTSNTR